MFFNDHAPPHFHVEYQNYQATISIQEGIVEGKMPRRALELIFEWLKLHQVELMKNWDNIEHHQPLNKIQPLD